MTIIKLGNKKKSYKSIKEAAAAFGVSYMVFYMRLRAGKPVKEALKAPVRPYNRKQIAA